MEPTFPSIDAGKVFLEEAARAASSNHQHVDELFRDGPAPHLNGETVFAACGAAHVPEAVPVHRHPAMALYDAVFAVALPAVPAFAGCKNVPVSAL